MRNSFGGIACGEERITQQLMNRKRIRIQFGRVLERRNGGCVVTLLHVSVTQPKERNTGGWIEVGCFAKRSDGLVEIMAVLGIPPGLQQRGHIGRGWRRALLL